MALRSVIKGCGGYLPARCVTNAELAEKVETSDEWIVQRTGIRQRYLAADGETTSDLATKAARAALDHAGIAVDAVDMIVVATTTPERTFPATAARVQANLGMTRGFAFDVQAVCSGFIYALTVADQFIRNGSVRTALVIGAETLSHLLDWKDRTTCVLFGDGAGAVVLQAAESAGTLDDQGVLSTHLHSDGTCFDLLTTNGGPGSTGTVGHIQMEGREVFRHAVSRLAEVVDEVLEANHLPASAIDWLVPHQANQRIIDSTAKKLGLPDDRVVKTMDRHANTSAASIPLALADAVYAGRIQRGQLLLLESMGGGFTWGAALVRW